MNRSLDAAAAFLHGAWLRRPWLMAIGLLGGLTLSGCAATGRLSAECRFDALVETEAACDDARSEVDAVRWQRVRAQQELEALRRELALLRPEDPQRESR
jgi:hypothetical protein